MTVTVPGGFSKLLVVEGLTVNGTSVPTCSGCGVRVEEGARWCEVCRQKETGRLVVFGPVVSYVRGAGIAADRKVRVIYSHDADYADYMYTHEALPRTTRSARPPLSSPAMLTRHTHSLWTGQRGRQ